MGVDKIFNHLSAFKFFIGFTLIFSVLASCATKEMVVKEDEREVLRRRIEEYWKLNIDGFSEKAYLYLVPAYREKNSVLQYAARFRLVKYREAEVMEIEVRGDEANSLVNVTYTLFLKRVSNKELKRIEKERWARIDGIWYHVPEGFELNSK